jgi:peptidoglycan/LPS O-acetylase OafA/YrhL
MTELTVKKPHYPTLDGLRGLAILLVVFYHNFDFISYSIFGWIGVDLFFVLSGYLITTILLNSLQSPGYLQNFFAKRILRIFPLYYLCLIIFLVILPSAGIYKKELEFYTDNQAWYWFYLQNWLLSFRFPKTGNLLNHFWSLAVEEQFYLIWPFIILWLRKPKKLMTFIFIVILLLLIVRSTVWMWHFPHFNYTTFYSFTRIDGICIGCLIALIHKVNFDFLRHKMAIFVTILAVMNFGFYFLNQYGEFPYLAFVGYTTFAGMFGLLVHESVTGDTKFINFIFRQPLLKFFGRISYGFYIFHWPIFVIAQPCFNDFFLKSANLSVNTSTMLASLAATLLAFTISVISYYTFEIRFLRLKEKFK